MMRRLRIDSRLPAMAMCVRELGSPYGNTRAFSGAYRATRVMLSPSASSTIGAGGSPSGSSVRASQGPAGHHHPSPRGGATRVPTKKVLAWFAAPAFDLPQVQRILSDVGPTVLCPPASGTATTIGGGSAASSGSGGRGGGLKATPVKETNPQPSVGSSPELSSENKCPFLRCNFLSYPPVTLQPLTSGTCSNAHSSMDGGPPSSSSTPAKPVVLCMQTTCPPQPSGSGEGQQRTPSFVFFADGGLVGWDATWSELVAIRQAVEKAVPPPTNATLNLSLRAPLVESISYDTYGSYRLKAVAAAAGIIGMGGAGAPGGRMGHSSPASPTTQPQPQPQPPTAAAASPTSSGTAGTVSTSTGVPPDTSTTGAGMFDLPEDERNFIDSTTDTIVIGDDKDPRTKMAYSYALAQSVKLDAVDVAISPISVEVKRWQQSLATSGKVLCTVKKLRQAKTHTLTLIEYMNFKHHIQTTPKLFWSHEFQSLRGVYKETCEHLELTDRGAALKQKLDTVDGSVTYLHHEVHASSNEFLTWVIIWLITAELLHALGVLRLIAHSFLSLFIEIPPSESGGSTDDHQ